MILSLHDSRDTAELKKKLENLLDPYFVNNAWCSKWSEVLAKYIFWIIQEKGEWTAVKIMGLERLFMIEMAGTALVALTKICGNKDN